MSSTTAESSTKKFGTIHVFLTAISTILGAILFLRFGWAVGNVGFWGTLGIVLLGHIVTIPTALALAEIATNQKVEGGGEYYIISRSFGLNIGAAIGFALYLSQAISVAFYIVAFGEAFGIVEPYIQEALGVGFIDKRFFTVPALLVLMLVILTKGASVGMKALYIVIAILFASLIFFFIGETPYGDGFTSEFLQKHVSNPESFFYVFAIVFPAFTGMTAGVGLSGDLKDPSKSIPFGTLAATITGMCLYVLIAFKMAKYASPDELVDTSQLIMAKISAWGPIIPMGLAAATISSAIGSALVAPRTLQALAKDKIFIAKPINDFLKSGVGEHNEPRNASIATSVLALVFVLIGDVDFVAEIISMFFMVTYGSLCLISFFQHFSGDPAYRPSFRSKWYISLLGGLVCFFLMFKMNATYAALAILIMVGNYFAITLTSSRKEGLANMVQNVISQFARRIMIFLQKAEKEQSGENWRPSVICLSQDSFKNLSNFHLMKWIADKYGFGSYIHYIEGYFSSETQKVAKEDLKRLIKMTNLANTNFYVDTLISPSFTSAIAQIVQLPGISGQDNNMILFDFQENDEEGLKRILENYGLLKAASFDTCILKIAERDFGFQKDIHIWMSPYDLANANLTVLLGYIMLGHNDWKGGQIKVFAAFPEDELMEQKKELDKLIISGRLPVSKNNLLVYPINEETNKKDLVNKHSAEADLVIMGINESHLKQMNVDAFMGYDQVGNILFAHSNHTGLNKS
ncbi:MAG: hypothetical protein N4A46_16080 [Schleiferiaceae bacterium]|jgi:amino acid transporter|nr:hypothetical protein [Schleiferiaceae bacterium]